jgi:hypothetical protein
MPKPSGSVVENDVRSGFMTPATGLPSGLVSETRWNHPLSTSMPIGAVGATSAAAFSGVKVATGAVGACVLEPDWGRPLPAQAASTPEAPTASAVIACRRFMLTWRKDT